MNIIGTLFYGHDSALFHIDTTKKTIFAISTERVTRIKHDDIDIAPILEKYQFPHVDYVCHGYNNFDESTPGDLRLYRILRLHRQKALRRLIKPTYIKDLNLSASQTYSAKIRALLTRPIESIKDLYILSPQYEKTFYKDHTNRSLREAFENYMGDILGQYNITPKKIEFYDHHLCHAAGAYYFSPFAYKHKTLSLTIDASGDGFFSKLYLFDGDKYEEIGNSPIELFTSEDPMHLYHFSSIGALYGNFTEALGLRRCSDEGKVEALAAFDEKDEALYNQLMTATTVSAEGIAYDVKALEPLYEIDYLRKQIKKIGEEPFAATIQAYLEDTVVAYLNFIAVHHDIEYLCLSGGVAANIIMSLNIYERTKFKHIFVIPPMGDEGVALGSALLKAVEMGEDISWVNQHYMPYFGNTLTQEEIKQAIELYKNRIHSEYIGDEWYKDAARSIAEDKIVSVVHGRMEFGPRALGNRSILANPVNPDIRGLINLKVKKRPKYQPFCPSILEEERERLFHNSFSHKHMAIAFRAKEEFHDKIPSAIHIDGTARPQFIKRQDNPAYYDLIKEVKKYTGFGVVINTSFNLHGRTIVHTTKDALEDFLDCNIDELYIEGFRVTQK